MFGRSSILLPGKSVGIRQRRAAVHERIRRRHSTVLGSVPARSYGIGLWWPGPSLQHSRVVARPLGIFQDIGWSPGLGIHNHRIAEVPSLGCRSLHLPPERVNVVAQGVAWLHGGSRGHSAQRDGCPCVARVRGFVGISRPERKHRMRCPFARVLVGIAPSFRSRAMWGGWPTTCQLLELGSPSSRSEVVAGRGDIRSPPDWLVLVGRGVWLRTQHSHPRLLFPGELFGLAYSPFLEEVRVRVVHRRR